MTPTGEIVLNVCYQDENFPFENVAYNFLCDMYFKLYCKNHISGRPIFISQNSKNPPKDKYELIAQLILTLYILNVWQNGTNHNPLIVHPGFMYSMKWLPLGRSI